MQISEMTIVVMMMMKEQSTVPSPPLHVEADEPVHHKGPHDAKGQTAGGNVKRPPRWSLQHHTKEEKFFIISEV